MEEFQYVPGDKANGYILGNDYQWYPSTQPAIARPQYASPAADAKKKGTGTGCILSIILVPIAVVVIVVLLAIAIPLFLGQRSEVQKVAISSTVTNAAKTLSMSQATGSTVTLLTSTNTLVSSDPTVPPVTLSTNGTTYMLTTGADAVTAAPITTETSVGSYWCVSGESLETGAIFRATSLLPTAEPSTVGGC